MRVANCTHGSSPRRTIPVSLPCSACRLFPKLADRDEVRKPWDGKCGCAGSYPSSVEWPRRCDKCAPVSARRPSRRDLAHWKSALSRLVGEGERQVRLAARPALPDDPGLDRPGAGARRLVEDRAVRRGVRLVAVACDEHDERFLVLRLADEPVEERAPRPRTID